MRVITIVFLVLGTFLSTAEEEEDYQEYINEKILLEPEISEDFEIQKDVRVRLLHSKQCSRPSMAWRCTTACFEVFTNFTNELPNKCVIRTPGETCFGQHLDYARVLNDNRFPIEYQVLQNYPKCWSYLAPLICTNHFRPCTIHRSSLKRGPPDNKTIEPIDVELWAQVRKGFCEKAISACQEVIDAGYFPNFIRCDNKKTASNTTNSPSLGIYSDSCPISSPPMQFNFTPKCPDPLVYLKDHIAEATPVMDQCYLKCRPIHLTFILYQHFYQIFCSLVLTILFLAIWVYLHFFSTTQRKNFATFCMSQALIYIAIYTICWSVGPIFLKGNDCVAIGEVWVRRTIKIQGFHHPCIVQSTLLTFAISAAYSWLSAVAYFGLVNPKWLRENEKTLSGLPIRSVLLGAICILSATYALILQFFHLHETDGVSGVCTPGLLSTHTYTSISIVPIFSTVVMMISCHIYRRFCEKAAVCTALEYFKNRYEYEVDRRKRFCNFKDNQNPTADDLKNVDETELEEAEENGDIKNLQSEKPPRQLIDFDAALRFKVYNFFNFQFSNADVGGYAHRIIEKYDKPKFRDAFRKGLEDAINDRSWEDIIQQSVFQLVASYMKRINRHRLNFVKGIGFNWLATMIATAIVVVWFAIPLHYFFVNVDESLEKEYIKDYVQCAVSQSLYKNHTEWIYTGTAEDAFKNCQLKSYLSEQRATLLLTFFIILPVLPFMVLSCSVLVGLFGRGGMKTISDVRWKKENGYVTLDNGHQPTKQKKTITVNEEEEPLHADEDKEEQPQAVPHRPLQQQSGPASNASLATTHHREENSEREATAPLRPQSSGEFLAKGINTSNLAEKTGQTKLAQKLSPSNMPKRPAANEDKDLEIMTRRLKGFIDNYGSSTQGMNPMPTVQDAGRLAEDLRAASRRERILSSQHTIAMEAMRDLSAFVNYHAEKLRSDEEQWTNILAVLQNLLAASDDLFPEHVMPDGLVFRDIPSEYAKLYEVLLSITEMMKNIDSHMTGINQWRDVTTQAGTRIQTATRNITRVDPNFVRPQPGTSNSTANNTNQAMQIQRVFQLASASGGPPVYIMQGPAEPLELRVFPNQQPNQPVFMESRPLQLSQAEAPQQGAQSRNYQITPLFPQQAAQPAQLTPQNNSTTQRAQAQQVQPQAAQPSLERNAVQQSAAPANQPVAGLNRVLLQQRQIAQNLNNQQQQQAAAAPAQNGAAMRPGMDPTIQVARRTGMMPRPNLFQNQGQRQSNQGSAYMETYSAAPAGFITRFTDQELQIRASRMSEIHGNVTYPQELIYAFILTGDIRLAGNDQPNEAIGERLVMPNEYPQIFGRAIPIDVVTAPREFLVAMRRRAILYVMILGFHYNARGRHNHIPYTPPIFPDLGMSSTNELLLIRIFGTENIVRAKDLLIQLMSRTYIEASPQIPEVGSFAAYFDSFASARGFRHQRDEWVHDPEHTAEPINVYSPPPKAENEEENDVSDGDESDEDEEEDESEEEESSDEDEVAHQPSTSGLRDEIPPVEQKTEEPNKEKSSIPEKKT